MKKWLLILVMLTAVSPGVRAQGGHGFWHQEWTVEKGLSAQSRTTVTAANTAATMGSGDLGVFATPSMVALMEHAAMTAVAAALPEGSSTVGAEMNVTHIKPSGLGAEITATAVLTGVEGRKLTFNVGARDAEGMIGEGVHVRYVVDREKFMAKVR